MKTSATKITRRNKGVVADVLLGILVVAVLAGTVAPRLIGHNTTTAANPTKAEIASLSGALQHFKADCGRFPTDDEGLAALKVAPRGLFDKWNGPYLEQPIGVDQWGRAYVYEQHGSGDSESCIVESYGADGKPGGTGDNADIVGGAGN